MSTHFPPTTPPARQAPASTKPLTAHMVEAIETIQGVHRAAVNLAPNGRPTDIFIRGAADRNPRHIVRDVEAILAVDFHITIDYRIIGVLQIRPPTTTPQALYTALQSAIHAAHSPGLSDTAAAYNEGLTHATQLLDAIFTKAGITLPAERSNR